VLAALLCFLFFVAFTALGSLGWFGGQIDHLILMLGIQHHYNSVSRGIVDSKDIIYFLSLIVLFIFCTKTVLESRKW
jgi:ABC-2 type transport system permease protein